MRVLIIIPAFNERESIVKVMNNLRSVCPEYDYLIVDDGSSDGMNELCAQNGYHYVSHEANLGLDGAFQTGMRYAYEHDYDAAVQFDSDGQHLPEYLHPLADKIAEGYDIVIGSRFVNQKKKFSMRMFGSSLISGCIRLTSGKTIKDPTSGMRMFSRRIIKILSSGINFPPEPDTVCYLIRCGAKCLEIPITMKERECGQSFFSISRSMRYMVTEFLSILIVQWFRKKITLPDSDFSDHGNDGVDEARKKEALA